MDYRTVTVVVDGALEDEQYFTNDVAGSDALSAYLDRTYEAAIGDRKRTEVYVLYHSHEIGAECECAQYATDHRPEFVWP